MQAKNTAIEVANYNYVAWAINTGPAHVIPLWKGSNWIAGEWTGANSDLSEAQIRADIDARVQCVVQALQTARGHLTDSQKQRGLNVFAVPEFYFHAKEGPYPNVRLNGLLPFEYIQDALKEQLSAVSLLPAESWILLSGCVLTSSESDYAALLHSSEVAARLAALNRALPSLAAEKGFTEAAHFRAHGPHIRAHSYDAADAAQKTLRQRFSPGEQAINDLMTLFRADPLCVVRNRGLAFTLAPGSLTVTRYEKQNMSTVDLTMGKLTGSGGALKLDPAGMITEWMAGYPSIQTINGDKQIPATPLAARFTLSNLTSEPLQVGVEICLDHRLKRLRRTVNMTVEHGAAADNPPLHIQLIPSGGMQILDYSASAGTNGVMFNADGCDPILDVYTSAGKPIIEGSGTFKQITCGVYASSAQALVEQHGEHYYSHSQLSFRSGGEMESYDNARGTANVNGATFTGNPPANLLLDAYPPANRIAVEIPKLTDLFAAGFGELHIYAKP